MKNHQSERVIPERKSQLSSIGHLISSNLPCCMFDLCALFYLQECIEAGVRKFNVNTEVRNAYLESLRRPSKDLVHVMASAKEAMRAVVAEKMRLFGSSGKALD